MSLPGWCSLGYPGCNRAAVYNYIYDTWYFYDLPYIVGGALSVAYTGATYSDLSSVTYDNLGGTYDSFFDATRLYLVTIGKGNGSTISPAVRIFEPANVSTGGGIIDTVASAPIIVENRQMDMDLSLIHI